ncbi:MAG: hypothetical protein PF689_08180 [Deltaproteobacteria bacterium]|jgi:hypothetical protein|nr:hypothetical protein [Deltaproteobacteria bacterium]
MKKLFLFSFLLAALVPAKSIGKVCFKCKSNKPVPYVCAEKDTFTARKNARKAGCNITSYSSTCKCGVTVDYKTIRNNQLEAKYFGWL